MPSAPSAIGNWQFATGDRRPATRRLAESIKPPKGRDRAYCNSMLLETKREREMNLDFLKETGESLRGTGVDTPEEFEQLLMAKVRSLRLKVADLDIQYDKGVATVMGMVADQQTKEKVLLAVGNVKGVARVKDSVAVGLSAKEQADLRRTAATKAGAKAAEVKIAAGKAAGEGSQGRAA